MPAKSCKGTPTNLPALKTSGLKGSSLGSGFLGGQGSTGFT
jgi:hypothetical protein